MAETPPNPKFLSMCISCPITGLPFYTGLQIKTILRQTKDRKWAEHFVHLVADGSIAHDLGLKVGQKLCALGKIMTDGMMGHNLQAQFRSLDLTNIEMVIERDKEDEARKQAVVIYASMQLDPDPNVVGLLVETKEEYDYIIPRGPCVLSRRLSVADGSCRVVELSSIESLGCNMRVAHPKVVDIVSIMHPSSEQYLKVENNKLVLYPLQKGDTSMHFSNGCIAVIGCQNQPELIFTFRERCSDNNHAYISVVNDNRVGVQILEDRPVLNIHPTYLNSDDPRLFVHKYATSFYSCFMSTALKDYYLAVIDNVVTVKKVTEKNLLTDEDIQFKLCEVNAVESPVETSWTTCNVEIHN